jgi:polygalacturonase
MSNDLAPLSRRRFLAGLSGGLATAALVPRRSFAQVADFDVRSYGAKGDGVTLDTAAIQKAIDAAAEAGARVMIPGGARFLTGALVLKSHIDFHLADDAMLLAATDREAYAGQSAIINADGAKGLKITGTGMIDGQAMHFMTTFSEKDERWEPMRFRPFMFTLKRCTDLEVNGIMFGHAPNWGMHLLGCERVLVDGVRIRNFLEVPNCDGIDPDRCRNVEIRNCDIVCADDAIVVKASEQTEDFGVTHNVHVHDCVVTTRDSGLKIGTETFGDISKVLFERCKVISGGRGPTITHRQKGNIEDVEFRDIEVTAEHHAPRWWGWGEAISITAWPRVEGGTVGSLKNIRLRNIKARAENSVRIDGQPSQPIEDVLLENIDVTIDKWTMYPGGHFDNRPTMAGVEGLEPHDTPAFFLRNVKNARIENCAAHWGSDIQPYFSSVLEAVHVQGLHIDGLQGEAAHPATQKRIAIDPA